MRISCEIFSDPRNVPFPRIRVLFPRYGAERKESGIVWNAFRGNAARRRIPPSERIGVEIEYFMIPISATRTEKEHLFRVLSWISIAVDRLAIRIDEDNRHSDEHSSGIEKRSNALSFPNEP